MKFDRFYLLLVSGLIIAMLLLIIISVNVQGDFSVYGLNTTYFKDGDVTQLVFYMKNLGDHKENCYMNVTFLHGEDIIRRFENVGIGDFEPFGVRLIKYNITAMPEGTKDFKIEFDCR
jgi:hypothetical protein